jgi:hypothetical protein
MSSQREYTVFRWEASLFLTINVWLKSGQYGMGIPRVTAEKGLNCCLKVENGNNSQYTLNEADGTTNFAEARYIRVIVKNNEGYAFTMPFRLTSEGIENPYPVTGDWYKGQFHNHIDAPEDASLARIQRYYEGFRFREYY